MEQSKQSFKKKQSSKKKQKVEAQVSKDNDEGKMVEEKADKLEHYFKSATLLKIGRVFDQTDLKKMVADHERISSKGCI